MLRSFVVSLACLSIATLAGFASPARAQEGGEAERFAKFVDTMKDVQMKGSFTVAGAKLDDLHEEGYVIKSVRKLPEGDYWLFDAQIEHNGKDMPLQIPIEVKWSGDTPVITLENFTIPGVGTFSARIVIYRDAYAGMWVHGPVKGHMFGVIEKNAPAPAEGQPAETPAETPKP